MHNSDEPFRQGVRNGYLIATLGVALATALLSLVRQDLDKAHVGLVFLLVVAAAAAAGGTRPALLAAVLSFLCWDFFFLLPLYTLALNDARDWLLLLVFLFIGVLVGQITGRLRAREVEARARERDTAALYHAILAVYAETSLETTLTALAEQIIRTTRARGCAILHTASPAQTQTMLAWAGQVEEMQAPANLKLAEWVAREAKAVGLGAAQPMEEGPWPISVPHPDGADHVLLPLNLGERSLGVLYAAPAQGSQFSEGHCRLMVAFASQAAALLERNRLIEKAAEAAAQQEAERLKGILFSSLSHNLKTPLASLTATLSSLRHGDVDWEPGALRDSLALMAEDVARLTEDIENLLNLAQLESGNWKPQPECSELREVILTALRSLPETDFRRVAIDIEDIMVTVDLVQMPQVVRHLVENALAYSAPDSIVHIGAAVERNTLRLWVDDSGPGIDAAEADQIFSKFYRGKSATQKAVRGTGLGLAICKEIITAHHGTIRVSRAPQGGARLEITLPMAEAAIDDGVRISR